MMLVAIIANGDITDYSKTLTRLSEFDQIIAADGGTFHCKKMVITPDLIIGDMDSTSEETLRAYKKIPQFRYPIDKDKTDLELAIEKAIEGGADSIVLFGALGKRIDHCITTLQLLYRYKSIISVESQYETTFALTKKNIVETAKNQVISFFTIGCTKCIISSKGLKWELERACLSEKFMSLSNVCLNGKFEIEVHEGTVLCSLVSTI